MKKVSVLIVSLLFAMMFAMVPTASHAYLIFFGEDLNNSYTDPLAAIPNSYGAETSFLNNLIGVGTEDFESFSDGDSVPLNLVFPGAGTATLSGGSGAVEVQAAGTAEAGRYSIDPPANSEKFWEVSAGGSGNFEISFTDSIAAFGFYGVDIGDFGGQLELELSLAVGGTTNLVVNNTIGSDSSTDGSVLYYGIIAQNSNEVFTNIDFLTTTGEGDVFGFDRMTTGSLEQVKEPVPEPATFLLLGFGLFGIAGMGRKRILKRR